MVTEPPEAPRNLEVVELSHHGISLEWLPPRNDGGAPVRNYVVERRQGFSSRFLTVARGSVFDTFYRDTTVYEGMTYEYRVAAETEAGVGAFTPSTGPVLVQDMIGQCLQQQSMKKITPSPLPFPPHTCYAVQKQKTETD